jgi:cytochrome oxidase assembly protein ShyY1
MSDKTNLITENLEPKKLYKPWQNTKPKTEFTKILTSRPGAWKYLAGFGVAAWVFGAKYHWNQLNAQQELEFRKAQLSKPAVELSAEQAVNPPWNKDNLHEWLYRHVIITGRPMHHKTQMIPRRTHYYDGFEYVVPLVTKENPDGSNQHGVLLSRGWIPHEWEHPAARWKVENARSQRFYGYLSELSELDYKHNTFKIGNSPIAGRNKWGHVYLPDMAKATGFVNQETTKLAVIEQVEEGSPLDERNPRVWAYTLNQQEDYPHQKTHSGALQLHRMPWEYQADRNCWLTIGGISWTLAVFAKYLI